MKPWAIFFLLALVACMGSKTYPAVNPTFSSTTIHEIKEALLPSGEFNVEGFVIAISACPPCPTPGTCAPCPPETVTISELNKTATDSLQNSDMVVFADKAGQFTVGRRYRFSILITERRTVEERFNDVELVGYGPIKT